MNARIAWPATPPTGSRRRDKTDLRVVSPGIDPDPGPALRGAPAVCYRPRVMGDSVTLAREGAIATVTLNRPDRRNALSDAMLTELGAAFAELRDDAATDRKSTRLNSSHGYISYAV